MKQIPQAGTAPAVSIKRIKAAPKIAMLAARTAG
jgi:hypothetical protein